MCHHLVHIRLLMRTKRIFFPRFLTKETALVTFTAFVTPGNAEERICQGPLDFFLFARDRGMESQKW